MIDHSLTQYNSTQTYINSVAAPTMAAACLHLQSSFMCERLRGCDIILTACENKDHPVSVAKVTMTTLKGQKELDQFYLTRSEYANEIGKTPNAVRMMMRHGKLTGEYRFDGSKIYF